jgi:hypothetical protein
MKFKTKLGLSLLLGLSIIAMIACVIKTIELKALGDPVDFTMSTVNFVVWFTIEQYIVIIVASVPTLRPLVIHLSKKFPRLKRMKDFWKVTDSKDESGREQSRSPGHVPHPRHCQRSERPRVIRLLSQKSYDKLELEPPAVHPASKETPPDGTIRKTVSVYIRPETPTQEHLESYFEATVSANSQQRSIESRIFSKSPTRFGRDWFDRDIEMQ